jgi:hypothetical protein
MKQQRYDDMKDTYRDAFVHACSHSLKSGHQNALFDQNGGD